MAGMEKVIDHLNECMGLSRRRSIWVFVRKDIIKDVLVLLKEQQEEIENLKQTAQSMMEGTCLLKEQEAIKPTINEYGEAYCICGENVGIIPSSKNLPSIRSKYCSECGRRMLCE